MTILKILLFPLWFPLWLLWKICFAIANFLLSSIALFFKLAFLLLLGLAIVAIMWLV